MKDDKIQQSGFLASGYASVIIPTGFNRNILATIYYPAMRIGFAATAWLSHCCDEISQLHWTERQRNWNHNCS